MENKEKSNKNDTIKKWLIIENKKDEYWKEIKTIRKIKTRCDSQKWKGNGDEM